MRLLKSALRRLGVENREDLKKLVLQFIRFGFVGLSNTLVSLACYYLFLWINEDLYLVGSIVGTIVSIANAFFWNDRYVFPGGKHSWRAKLKRLGKTYVSYGGTSILTIALLWLEVQLGVSRRIAPIVNLIITIPLNFIINKLWTFKK
jgi:putative flippase GtrA